MKNRGEIWLVKHPPLSGSGRDIRMLVVILSVSSLHLNSSPPYPLHKVPFKIVAPILRWRKEYTPGLNKWMVELIPDTTPGLPYPAVIDLMQLRSLHERNFLNNSPIGQLSHTKMGEVEDLLKPILGL